MFRQPVSRRTHTAARGTEFLSAQLFYAGIPIGTQFVAHTREELIAIAVKHIDRHTATSPRLSADRDAWTVRISVPEEVSR